MTSASDQPVSFEPSTLSEDHPAYATHQAAIRSVQRVINDMAPYQNVEVASTGIGQLLQLQPLILTGAGMSTDSGIPDYRGPEGSLRHSRPMTYQEFLHDDSARRRYWARSFVGWQHISDAAPHAGHEILARWNARGIISGIVTQNVDGLHQRSQRAADAAAGQDAVSGPIIPLHGSMDEVECLVCGVRESREEFGHRLQEANRDVAEHWHLDDIEINPDGDARIPTQWVQQFTMVRCLNCGSDKQTNCRVFWRNRSTAAQACISKLLEASGGLIVVGSSLAVMVVTVSFWKQIEHKPIGIINLGPTRGEQRATFRWRSGVRQALEWLDSSHLTQQLCFYVPCYCCSHDLMGSPLAIMLC